MAVTTSSDGAPMRASAPAPAGPPVVPGLRGLVPDPVIPRLWLGWMDDDPIRVLLIESGRIPFEPVVAALERLRPATEHRFASRLRGCHAVGPNGLAVVTDHHPLGSLERVVARSGPGSEAEALAMASEVCEAVAHCHGAGFVHGHIGPGTVMLGDDGHPRLAAHGALGELEAGLGVRPTPPGIVPPEGRPSAAGDIYAIGLIAVYAATGMLDPRAMPKRWAPLIGPALDVDPARRPNDLVMFAAGMRSVADALRAGASVAVIDVPGAHPGATPTAPTVTRPTVTGATMAGTRAAGPQAIVDGLQLNKIPRRRGRGMAVLGSVVVLATAGVAAGAIYAATRNDEAPSTTVPVSSSAPGSVTTAAPPAPTISPVTTPTVTTLPTTTLPTNTLPTNTVPATTVPVTEPPVTVPVTEAPATSTTRRTSTTRATTTRATTTRASTPTTRTSTPSSSPGTTSPSTLPPDVERGRD